MNNLRFVKEIIKLRIPPTVAANRCMAQKVETKLSTTNQPKSDDDEPIQFIGSQAALWRAKSTHSGGADEHLWYQPYVISASLAVFLLYFCVFREESDIDLKLEGSLYEHLQGLEEVQLIINYKYNKENGLNNQVIIQRLQELGVDVKLLDAKIAEGN